MKWEKVEIGKIAKVISGFAFKSKDFQPIGTPIIKIKSIKEENIVLDESDCVDSAIEVPTRFHLSKGDILISLTGSHITLPSSVVGRVARYRHETNSYLNQRAGKFINIDIEKCHNDYLFYFLLQKETLNKIANKAQGAANQANISPGDVEGVEINLPPLPTQRRIASILSAYDDLIENNLKRIKLLEEKAFVAYKLLMSSEKLIEGKVGDLADVKSGFAFKGADWTDEGFPVIKIKNIGNNDIDLTDCSLIPENIAEAAAKFKLNAGDLLIAMTGATVGKIGMMPRTETTFYLNQRVGLFKPKVENAELFLFCFYNEPSAKDAVESLASGAAQPNISGGQLESIKLFYPKLETVTEFGSSIKSHFEMIWNLKQQNTKLREARDILLPKLINGQIEV
jgi:type I restriction enzyme S subunit